MFVASIAFAHAAAVLAEPGEAAETATASPAVAYIGKIGTDHRAFGGWAPGIDECRDGGMKCRCLGVQRIPPPAAVGY
jgi:hypothetical protein